MNGPFADLSASRKWSVGVGIGDTMHFERRPSTTRSTKTQQGRNKYGEMESIAKEVICLRTGQLFLLFNNLNSGLNTRICYRDRIKLQTEHG